MIEKYYIYIGKNGAVACPEAVPGKKYLCEAKAAYPPDWSKPQWLIHLLYPYGFDLWTIFDICPHEDFIQDGKFKLKVLHCRRVELT